MKAENLPQTSATVGFKSDWAHGGDLVARQLVEFGVKHLFTLTGGHISTVYDGVRFTDIELIDFRHEQAAVHAADAYARISRQPAVAALTAGPGVTGGLTGVANAFYAQSPVVTIGGRNPFVTDGAGNLQEAPHLELMSPVTKYSAAVYDSWRLGEVMYDAFQAATMPRTGPAYIDLPMDVQLSRMSVKSLPPLRQLSKLSRQLPDPDLIKEIAVKISKAKQPVVMAGTGAYWGRSEKALSEFLDTSKIPVYLNGMGRGLLGKNHLHQIYGGRKQALQGADLVLLLGVDIDFRLGFGQEGVFHREATLIQVDPDASKLGHNCNVDYAVNADISAFIEELTQQSNLIGKTELSRWHKNLLNNDKARNLQLTERVAEPEGYVHPQNFVREVAEYLDPGATVIGDGGDIVSLFSGTHKPGGAGHWMDPGPFGCLGVGAPFAMAARLMRPSDQVAVIYGDGAFGFNGMEYESAVRQNLPFVGIMGNDGAWGEMRNFHEDIFGDEYMEAQYLSHETSYEKIVEGCGGYAERVTSSAEIKPALERAFASGVPALVNVILDPTYRRVNTTISGKHVAKNYGGGNADKFKR